MIEYIEHEYFVKMPVHKNKNSYTIVASLSFALL